MTIRIFVTGGTFDKEYNELEGKLYFKDTHLHEMLELGRCKVKVEPRTLMMIDSLEMTDLDRQIIVENCVKCGAANGRNPLPIVVPCHRVIGSDGSLTGYGGGLQIKEFLLELERRCPFQPPAKARPTLQECESVSPYYLPTNPRLFRKKSLCSWCSWCLGGVILKTSPPRHQERQGHQANWLRLCRPR